MARTRSIGDPKRGPNKLREEQFPNSAVYDPQPESLDTHGFPVSSPYGVSAGGREPSAGMFSRILDDFRVIQV